MDKALHQYLEHSVSRFPDRVAVEDPSGTTISYSELGELTDRLRSRLQRLGVGRGDRVAFYLNKSIDSIISIYGILKAGAAYVPLDPTAPPSRNAYIVLNCSVSALIIDDGFVNALDAELAEAGEQIHKIILAAGSAVPRMRQVLASENSAEAVDSIPTEANDLAYILYTSGSTGKPKGVMLTHENAVSFVDWCSEVFRLSESDRCSSHAPLHFDLSILDVHLALKHGATLILIGEDTGKTPDKLAGLIAEKGISVWYSTPSILGLMAEFGKMQHHDYSKLRLVLFAGEVFPIKHLRALKKIWRHPAYFNLYGPTETNVCTFYEIPDEVEEDRTVPYPIGKPCSHYVAMVIDEAGKEVERGAEGELVMRGPAVTPGYWQLPERTATAYHQDPSGNTWYKTGDIVVEAADGNFTFLGRRDRMIKKRGFRIELGEIESCLYQHKKIEEAGVIATVDADDNTIVQAFVSPRGGDKLSIVSLKGFCAKRLPQYMIPDRIVILEKLPRTSTDKVDYQGLKNIGA